jgi:hypothetical protein
VMANKNDKILPSANTQHLDIFYRPTLDFAGHYPEGTGP